MRKTIIWVMLLITGGLVAASWWSDARPASQPVAAPQAGLPATTRDQLHATVTAMEARLAARPDDAEAVVRLSEALVRLQRVESDAAAVIRAEDRLRAFLALKPDHYEAQRVLGTVLLSQHRFRDALREAERARAIEPRDSWNYGVIGDAHLELGEYEQAFAAFDRMGSLRPGPPAYARVAYAFEIKGDLEQALEQMRMAADGTSGHDSEGQAWHYAQLGNLLLQQGKLGDARREFERAAYTFPDHPYAVLGLARVKIAEKDYGAALAMHQAMYEDAETPELAFVIGDLYAQLGQPDKAEEMYVTGERLERDGWASEEPQPQALARFLAERGRNLPSAIALGEEAAAKRRDVHTMDALAWAYFKAGRLDDAARASDAATRTGIRDARIVSHAAAIRAAQGDEAGAQALRQRAANPMPDFTLLAADTAASPVQSQN